MRILKHLLTVSVCLALIASFCIGFVCISIQNNAGGHSSFTAISERDRQWICDHFGECDSIECLLLCVEEYAVQNFRYDKRKIPLFQHFDFHDLIDSKKGICFDFAAWVKTCCLVWAERNDIALKVYVVDVEYDFFKPRHSYNVVALSDGRCFYIDTTNSINEAQKNKYRKIRGNSFDRVECTLIHQITTPMEQLGLSNLLLRDVTTLHIERIMQYNLERGFSYSTLKKSPQSIEGIL